MISSSSHDVVILKRLIKQSGCTIIDCVNALDVSKQTMYNYINNPFALSLRQLMLLSSLFKVPAPVISHLIINCTTTTPDAIKWYEEVKHITIKESDKLTLDKLQ